MSYLITASLTTKIQLALQFTLAEIEIKLLILNKKYGSKQWIDDTSSIQVQITHLKRKKKEITEVLKEVTKITED